MWRVRWGGGCTAGKFVEGHGSVGAVVGLAWSANTSPHMPSKDANHVDGDALKASQSVCLYGYFPALIPEFFSPIHTVVPTVDSL